MRHKLPGLKTGKRRGGGIEKDAMLAHDAGCVNELFTVVSVYICVNIYSPCSIILCGLCFV